MSDNDFFHQMRVHRAICKNIVDGLGEIVDALSEYEMKNTSSRLSTLAGMLEKSLRDLSETYSTDLQRQADASCDTMLGIAQLALKVTKPEGGAS